MRKRHKILLVFIGGCLVMTAVSSTILKMKPAPEVSDGNNQVIESQHDRKTEETMPGAAELPAREIPKSKYEIEAKKDLTMDLSCIADFIGRGKQFILKRQIQVLAGDANNVRCLEYQRSDPENMRMEFFLLLDTGEILKGYYSYYTRETSLERSDLTEENVRTMMEEEKQALESEALAKQEEEKRAQEESERIAAEEKAKEEKKKTERSEKNKKETEQSKEGSQESET